MTNRHSYSVAGNDPGVAFHMFVMRFQMRQHMVPGEEFGT